jgi:hypothetical protein
VLVASRVTIEPQTLQMANVFDPLCLDSRCAAKVLHGLAHGVLERPTIHFALDKMGHNLRVSLCFKLVTLFLKLLLQLGVVFNNAVVHDGNLPGAVMVGMCVFVRSGGRVSPNGYDLCHSRSPSAIAAKLLRDYKAYPERGGSQAVRNTRRVIATIFEPL